jgi:tetratricopeptide (TPR) repeat protein
MKLAVYAIAKSEEKQLAGWHAVCREADHVVLVDTGSTDDTVLQARNLGVTVHQLSLSAWRFDSALNAAIALVPTQVDFCIRIDLDERLPPGWRQRVEAAAATWPKATRFRFRYIWNAHRPKEPKVEFLRDSLHCRHGYHWACPVHEALRAHIPEQIHTIEGLTMTHHPDVRGAAGADLPLLELSVQEDPADARRSHYLGREYYYGQRWSDAIRELGRHLSLPGATWAPERAASARFIAHSYVALKEDGKARAWFEAATRIDAATRDTWLDLAQFEFDRKNWQACVSAIKALLAVSERTFAYIGSDAPWGALPYDLGAVAAYYLGLHAQAKQWMLEALRRRPDDPRFVANAKFILGDDDKHMNNKAAEGLNGREKASHNETLLR